MPEIKSSLSLTLNWKKTGQSFRIKAGVPVDIPQDALEYLEESYPDAQFPLANTLVQLIEQVTIADTLGDGAAKVVEEKENALDALIVNVKKENVVSVKVIIEEALNQGIIEQQGTQYKYEKVSLCKSARKLKTILEEDPELLEEIRGKLNVIKK